jgi:hypothetical protein
MRKLAPLLALVGALAGCGAPSAFVRARDGVLRLTLDEYRVVPANVTAKAGRLEIVARNTGRLTHNLVIEEFSVAPGDEPHVYAKTTTAQPGQTVRVQTEPLRPGKYRLTCTIANHDDLGQYGELRITR